MNTNSPLPVPQLMLAGFAVWLAGTLLVRLAGQWMFVPNEPVLAAAVFAAGALLQFFLVRFLLDAFKVQPTQRAWGTGWMLLFPLLLDGLTFYLVGWLFPNLSAPAALLFAGWLLGLYGVGMLSGLLYQNRTIATPR